MKQAIILALLLALPAFAEEKKPAPAPTPQPTPVSTQELCQIGYSDLVNLQISAGQAESAARIKQVLTEVCKRALKSEK